MRGKIGGGGGGDADADADADASAGAGASEEKVDRVHMLPMDWSLKKKAVFTSTLPFECFQNSFTASPKVDQMHVPAPPAATQAGPRTSPCNVCV